VVYFISNRALFDGDNYRLCPLENLFNYFENRPQLPMDTETTGFDPHTNEILSVQIGTQEDQFVIDWASVDRVRVAKFLEDKTLLLHNAKFDLKFLYKYGIIPDKVFDTMLAEDILFCGLLHKRGLDHVVQRRLGVTLEKETRSLIKKEGLSERVILYGARDVQYLEAIQAQQLKELEEKDLQLTMRLENSFVRVLAYIEWCGFRLDELKWKKRTDEDIEKLRKKEEELNEYVVKHYSYSQFVSRQLDLFSSGIKCKVNWSSPLQVQKFMSWIGVDTQIIDKETDEVKNSVRAKVIQRQANLFPIINDYLEYKGYEKLVGTYGYNFFKHINEVTGRLHTQFQQIKDTGRISSGGKNKDTGEEYINFQNIPSDEYIRECFIPNEGNKLLISDYSGQEQIVLANKSMDPGLLEFYDKDLGDMHSFVASKIKAFGLEGLSLEEIQQHHKDKRQKAKQAGFAINYGGNGKTIAENLGVSEEEGEEVYQGYFEAFPGLKEYFKRAEANAHQKGYVLIDNVVKRKCFIYGFDQFLELKSKVDRNSFWDEYKRQKKVNGPKLPKMQEMVRKYFKKKGEIFRQSLNYPIQGESASMTKIAGIYLFEEILKKGMFGKVLIPNAVHDELVVECPAWMAEEWKEILDQCMLKAGAIFCKRVPIKADTKIADKWVK
jgi:DNA polymerase-1